MELFKSQITKLKSQIVCYLSFGAWDLLDSRTLFDSNPQFEFFNTYGGHDTSYAGLDQAGPLEPDRYRYKTKRAPPQLKGVPFFLIGYYSLGGSDIYRGRTFGTLLNVKGNVVAVIKRFETGCIDSTVMDKYIRAIFLLDEAVAFAAIKPFYNSINHCSFLLSINSHSFKLPECHFDKWNLPLERNRPAN